ncbi:hypothetical protein [Plantactinospora sp. BC1]|uniref:hypothetical protein n=1 Tax=Plantactinospora sp. BC1 TaxID=2108470 RepID=UPI00131F0128|nr:hypothetical protein [Plantactinospora sp. BC1]
MWIRHPRARRRPGRLRRPGAAVLLCLALVAAGCDAPREEPDPVLTARWQPVTLPVPSGMSGRLMIRDIATCAGRWYVVGAIANPEEGVRDADTRPVAWTSPDGRSWTSLRLTPRSYYGERSVLYSVACADGGAAVIGAKRGGAHANPRVSTWRQVADGSLVEVPAPFELYGGPQAMDVARIGAGPDGWLIAGNRMSGAAVWLSPDAARFEILEAAPGLAHDGVGETWAFEGIATAPGWLLVGGIVRAGRTDRDPLAWTSPDGRRWQRLDLPATDEYEELQRVVLLGGTPVAVGLRGGAFGAWRGAAASAGGPSAGPGSSGWSAVGRFGAAGQGGVPRVRALTTAGDRLLAATSNGSEHELWASDDAGSTWQTVTAPVRMPAGVYQDVVVRADEARVLLAVDDGERGGLWITDALSSGR